MNTRAKIMLGFVGVLAVVYVVFFTGLFQSSPIRIIAMLRENQGRRRPPQTRQPVVKPSAAVVRVYPVLFALDKSYRLTSVEVYAVADLEKLGSNAKPLWAMKASDAKPADARQAEETKTFFYGSRINMMKPADDANATPTPLEPDVTYRMLLRAGSHKGEVEFKTKIIAPTPPVPTPGQ